MIEMPEDTAYIDEDAAHYDKRYGVGKWQWIERSCSYLVEACGYGEPLDKTTCSYCDGKCLRPSAAALNSGR